MIGDSRPGRGWEIFSSPPCPDQLWGLPSLLFNGHEGLSLVIKRPGREADHSPPSISEAKYVWNSTSTPPIRLHGVVLSWITRTTLPLPFIQQQPMHCPFRWLQSSSQKCHSLTLMDIKALLTLVVSVTLILESYSIDWLLYLQLFFLFGVVCNTLRQIWSV
jgi:hypothetical protein